MKQWKRNALMSLLAGILSLPVIVEAQEQTLFINQKPTAVDQRDGDGVNYELGMRFVASASGQIRAIRFFKSPKESGTHIGRIFSPNGEVARVTFTSETASGWQQANLSAPLAIQANTEYLVSVNTGNSYYVASNDGLANQVSNGKLRSVVGNNGVYGPLNSRPTQSYRNSNYFRDIVFVAESPIVSKFKVGDRVKATRQVNVRNAGALSATLLGTQPTGALGKLVAGPTSANSIIWWRIDYDSGVDGFSGEDNFTIASATPSPTPVPSPTPTPNPTPVPPASSGLGAIPISFDDPLFFGNTNAQPHTILSNGTVATNLSWDVDTNSFSVGGGGFTLKKSRIRSNEGVRASGGNVNLDQVLIEVDLANPTDHADGYQAYGPGSTGVTTVTNSAIHAFDAVGYFAADNWRGDHIFDNVLFWGGAFGMRIACDGGATVSLNNVYFVKGSFGYNGYLLNDGGCAPGVTLTRWTNVYSATIVNGKIVLGAPIPPPCTTPCRLPSGGVGGGN